MSYLGPRGALSFHSLGDAQVGLVRARGDLGRLALHGLREVHPPLLEGGSIALERCGGRLDLGGPGRGGGLLRRRLRSRVRCLVDLRGEVLRRDPQLLGLGLEGSLPLDQPRGLGLEGLALRLQTLGLLD